MSTCTGDPDREPWWQNAQHLNAQAQAMYRKQFPDGCGLCGEPADAEMGEFWDPERNGGQGGGVIAHGQCGLDAGMEMA
jgi:hypothetical protein